MVNLAPDYLPQVGDAFPLATVGGSITGTLNLDSLPQLADGLSWDLIADAHLLSLNVVAQPGDFDSDGDVDGRDFLAWQRGGSPLALSAGDLADWQTHYGASSGAALASAVPEPASFVTMLFAIGILAPTGLCRLLLRVGTPGY